MALNVSQHFLFRKRLITDSLQAVISMPAVFKKLKGITEECELQIIFNEEMSEIFTSKLVKRRLQFIIELIVKILEGISVYCGESKVFSQLEVLFSS